MSWHERLSKASFKGVTLYVDATQYAKGRRVPVRKLAGQDDFIPQDLGRDPDEVEITCFYWGKAFDQERDALEAKLVEEGAGPLVLPTRGELQARVVSGPRTTESRDGLGFCSIRFSVVIEPRKGAGASAAPGLTAAKNTSSALKKSAAKAQSVAAASTAARAKVAKLPNKQTVSVLASIQGVVSKARSVQRAIQSQLNAVEDVSAAINELDSTANTILATPSAIATKIAAVVLGVVGIADTVERAIDRTTGLVLGDENATPFESASPARATIAAVKSFALLGTGETTSAGRSVGPTSSASGASTRVDSASVRTVATQASASSAASSGGAPASSAASSVAPSTDADVSADASTELATDDREELVIRAIYEGARALAVSRACETFATCTFDSSALALSALEVAGHAIDDLIVFGGSDALADALADVRAALADHLLYVATQLPATTVREPIGIVTGVDERRAAASAKASAAVLGESADPIDTQTSRKAKARTKGLPRVLSYTPAAEVPALLIAQEIYGDADLERDLIARNRIRHPLFVSQPIEIIEP